MRPELSVPILLILIGGCKCVPPLEITPKIVGGQFVTDQSQFAYMVSLRVAGRHICGGAIVDRSHVLTAAHCCFGSKNKFYPARLLSVLAGTLNIKDPVDKSFYIARVKSVTVHENYNPDGVTDDIALLELSDEFNFWSRNVQPIRLADAKPKNTTCTVLGWGVLEYNGTKMSDTLLSVEVPIVPNFYCRMFYGNQISSKTICAGTKGKDSCQGDSGGPLVCNGTLSGIVSWGSGCATYPGVYTAVSKYKSWIRKNEATSSSPDHPLIYPTSFVLAIQVLVTALRNKF